MSNRKLYLIPAVNLSLALLSASGFAVNPSHFTGQELHPTFRTGRFIGRSVTQLIIARGMPVREIKPVEGELGELLNKTFADNIRSGHIDFDGCILSHRYQKFADEIENFEVREDDVWVCGFPKSGTTWTQEMVWSIVNGIDSERSKVPIYERFPLLENASLIMSKEELPREIPAEMAPSNALANSIEYARNHPSPRFIKSHLPPHLLPRQLRNGEKRPTIVYVCRNPKDTCISYYHFVRVISGFNGSFEELCNLYLGDKVIYGPFWKNVLGFWNRRNDSNMIFLKYEDMKKDLSSVIKKTATFLGKNFTDDQVSLLAEHLSFSTMKVNPAVNNEGLISVTQNILQFKHEGKFMRSGKTEQWKTAMTPELIKRFDDWTRENLDGTGLSF